MDRCWTAGGFVRPWCTSLDAPLFLSLSLSLGASLSLSLRTTLASSVGALQETPSESNNLHGVVTTLSQNDRRRISGGAAASGTLAAQKHRYPAEGEQHGAARFGDQVKDIIGTEKVDTLFVVKQECE